MYFVYVLQNARGQYYVGQTSDLAVRLQQHNSTEKGTGKYTLKNGPWELVWSELHADRRSAVGRERQIKSMKSSRWIREYLLKSSTS